MKFSLMAKRFGCLLCLAGCVSYHPKPLSPADNATRLDERSLTNTSVKLFIEEQVPRELVAWPPTAWDLDLLIAAACYYHPDLEVARAQCQVADAGIRAAGGRPNPVLTMTPWYDFSAAAGMSPWIPAVNLDIPIETAGKRRHRIVAAEQASNSARLNYASVGWQIRKRLRAAAVDFYAAREHERMLEEQTSLQEQIVRRLEAQSEAGAIARSDVLPFSIALSKARFDLTEARRQLADSRAGLAEALGVPMHALSQVQLDFGWIKKAGRYASQLSSTEMRRTALLSRSDIMAALADYTGAEANLRLEIAKQYPDVHLNPGYQFDQGDNKWTIGITVELPVLNQNQGPIAVAAARREESAARFTALQAHALSDIDRAVQVLHSTQKSAAELQSIAQAQAHRKESAEAQFKAGATDESEVLRANYEYATADLAQFDGEIKLQQAIGALEDAIQSPLTFTRPLLRASVPNSSLNH